MTQNVSDIGAARTLPFTGRAMLPAAALAAVCSLALALRVYALDFGLPHVYNQDEIAIMNRALAFAKGDPNPHNFLYPTFYFYALFGWLGGYYLIARLVSAVGSMRDFEVLFFTDPTSIYLAGRLLTALCGTAAVLVTYAVGRRLWEWRAGLAASLFLAVAPFAVMDSHYLKHDVPATLAAVAMMLSLAAYLRPTGPPRAGWKAAALMGVTLGIAVAIHYYAVTLAVPALVAILCSRRGSLQARIVVCVTTALVAGAAFFVCSPFVLLDWPTAVRDVVANRQIVMDRAVGASHLFASTGRYLYLLWSQAIGWPVVVLAAIGVALLMHARDWVVAGALVSFSLVFLAFISNTVAATRYLNPLLPFLSLLAGYSVSRLALAPRGGQAAVAVTLLAALPGLSQSVRVVDFFSQADTRSQALAFIESHVPAGRTILVQPYSVPLAQSQAGLREALTAHLGAPERASIKFALRLSIPDGSRPSYRTLFLGDGGLDVDKIYVGYSEVATPSALGRLRASGIEYVVLKRYEKPDAVLEPLSAALRSGAERLAAFSPYKDAGKPTTPPFLHNTDAVVDNALARPGPIVEIWKLPPARDGHRE